MRLWLEGYLIRRPEPIPLHIAFAEWMLVIHQGRIRAEGTHAELLARQGLYARLYQLQYQLA